MARNCQNHDQRYKETYFTAFPGKYFTGDGALRDEVGITELQAVSMTLLSFQVITWELSH
jgi:acyl-coenzyme A synthetase/AMP-(fatty) acid ligase